MRQLPCPHCYERPASLDMHLRFECPRLYGRSRYVPQEKVLVSEIEKFLDIEAGKEFGL